MVVCVHVCCACVRVNTCIIIHYNALLADHIVSGYGNLWPTFDGSRAFCVVYALLGIPMFMALIQMVGQHTRRCLARIIDNSTPVQTTTVKRYIVQLLALSLLGFIIIVLIPSAVFVCLEGWDYGRALYFTAISISTIGFGDYVARKPNPARYVL